MARWLRTIHRAKTINRRSPMGFRACGVSRRPASRWPADPPLFGVI